MSAGDPGADHHPGSSQGSRHNDAMNRSADWLQQARADLEVAAVNAIAAALA
jgi:hypothetical protein